MRGIRRSTVALTALAAQATGLTSLLRQRRRRRGDHRVFILEYHDVTTGPEREGVVSADRFRAHLHYLKRDFQLESLSRGVALLREPGALDSDRVVVTFDDGYAGNFHVAAPILREENVPAAIFVTTGFLDGEDLWFDLAHRALSAAHALGSALPGQTRRVLEAAFERWPTGDTVPGLVDRLKYAAPELREQVIEALRAEVRPEEPPAVPLTWDQVRELKAAGIEIGSHTLSHPILSKLSPAAQEAEIRRASERIAEETGSPPALFAVPNGSRRDFDEHTVRILRDMGFAASCTTIRGPNAPGCDPLTLHRIGVGADPRPVLAARLAGLFDEGLRDRLGL
jgi:peptidoglycan/xylan/chitin deacetylase (PgdA/CDA1 family)